jgi:ubiquitin C-terminal hydrolase
MADTELGRGGIINMGNTCYANATIQALRNCTKVPWIFEMGRFNTLFKKEPVAARAKVQALATEFGEIVQLLWRCKKGQSVRPAAFWDRFREAVADTGFEHLAARQPHDCHEFYLFLLDALHESMAQEVAMRITRPPPTTDTEKHAVAALETWKREFEKKYSPLVDLFYGLQHVTTTCKTCGFVSHRWEIFSALKAQVPKEGPPKTLAEMLEAEYAPEDVEEYACDGCAPKRSPAVRRYALWRLPLHVVVVLKRFTWDGRKIQTPIAGLETGTFSFQPFFSAESPELTGEVAYTLHSLVDHHGVSNGGHYTAQTRAENGDWVLYDDESSMVIPGGKPVLGSSTYMMVLTRAHAKRV